MGVVGEVHFRFSLLRICSGDICDQSRKLSKIEPNCERFLPSQILLGATLPKLEIWGRAQLEAARRPKSDWKYNLWG